MANFNEKTTSNGFYVKDIEVFKRELEKMAGQDLFEINKDETQVSVAIEGNLESYIDKEDGQSVEYEYDDYLRFIQGHMRDGQTVVVSSIGYEKLNYLTADAAIITKSEIKFMNMSNIILAQIETMGIKPFDIFAYQD